MAILRPDSDIASGGWTGSYTDIDEVSAADGDYVESNKTTSVFEVGLSNPAATPDTGTVTIRWRGRRRLTNKSNTTVCRLVEGTTVLQSQTQSDPTGTFTTWSFTVASSAVSNWNDLRIRLDCTVNGGIDFDVSWVEVEVPDPATTPVSNTQASIAESSVLLEPSLLAPGESVETPVATGANVAESIEIVAPSSSSPVAESILTAETSSLVAPGESVTLVAASQPGAIGAGGRVSSSQVAAVATIRSSFQAFGLSYPGEPEIPGGSHVIRYRVRKDAAGGEGVFLVTRLFAGATKITESWIWADVFPETETTYEVFLSGAEVASLEAEGYGALEVRFQALHLGGGADREARVTWLEFGFPYGPISAVPVSTTLASLAEALETIEATGVGEGESLETPVASRAPFAESIVASGVGSSVSLAESVDGVSQGWTSEAEAGATGAAVLAGIAESLGTLSVESPSVAETLQLLFDVWQDGEAEGLESVSVTAPVEAESGGTTVASLLSLAESIESVVALGDGLAESLAPAVVASLLKIAESIEVVAAASDGVAETNPDQLLRAVLDLVVEGWVNELAQTSNLYASIDEEIPADADYVEST